MNTEYIYDRTETDLYNNAPKAFINASDLNRIEGGTQAIATMLGVTGTFITDWVQPVVGPTNSMSRTIPTKPDMDRIITNLNNIISIVQSRRDYTPSVEVPVTLDKATIYTMNNLERTLAEVEYILDEYYTDVWVGTNPNDEAYGKLYIPYVIAYQSNVDLDEHDDDIQDDTDGREKIWSAMCEPYGQGGYSHAPIYIGKIYAVPFYLLWEYESPSLVWGTDAQLAKYIDLETATLYACTQITAMGNETLTISDTVNNYTGEYTRYRLYFKID